MKLLALASLLALTAASPTPTQPESGTPRLAKRAGISDAADIGYATLNGGTKGGAGGTVTTVSTLAQFTAAVNEKNSDPAIVVVKGIISGNEKVRVGSNKSIIGLPGSGFKGVGLHFRRQSNLILRNIVSSFVEADNGDGLKIEESTNVWVDHCEFFSTLDVDKDYYDGLVDSSHGSDFITISHTYFHDHWKASLAGHSDSNGSQDRGKLHLTYANNYWKNINSRGPLLRFGTGHIYNSYFENMSTAINTRMGAQVLVQSNVFRNVTVPVTSRDSDEVGYATVIDTDLGGGLNDAPEGNMVPDSVGYEYSLLGSGAVAGKVPGEAGAILTF
ncbi:polysaccharide lyase family 1 protein [Thermothelomyces thermophilus ATCC 42464]|uniref:Polysaccharide lyase family 1 protein n=1 Tax=Thermothelomyces thermophilus (strain ATCC 42464 / BCRC 31852 / DSM 1799) TaxID=573729 RepID=G2Q1K5_THET4|nr:polysaccharide lyase family 1 protein [Thermothelomyces thermophilus ATCC 42464]AEO54996.1 polysaccharide lyase family 1 protein [Thermothelomyces thermophilus ATCC 42464]